MANILIATLGSRDLQLDASKVEQKELEQMGIEVKPIPQRSDIYGVKSPRQDGAQLVDHFNKIRNALHLPILQSALDYVLQNCQDGLHQLILITTNQNSEQVPTNYWHQDTTAIGELIKQSVTQSKNFQGCKVKKLEVREGVAEYDTMYEFMGKQLARILNDVSDDDQLYLLPQGGIDAINVATLLRSIELFPNTVQLAKPEDQETAFRLEFPRLFHQNLTKHKAQTALDHFDYNTLINLAYSEPVTKLAEMGYALMALNHQMVETSCQQLLEHDRDHRAEIKKLTQQIQLDNIGFLQQLTFLNACIQYEKEAFSEFLLKVFTLNENLLKPKVEELLGGKFSFDISNNHEEWNNLINSNQKLFQWLQNKEVGGKSLVFDYPNTRAYKAIAEYFNAMDDTLRQFNDWTLALAELRNKVAHEISGVTKEDIDDKLPGNESRLEDYLALGRKYFGIQGYGIFTDINHLIDKRLTSG